MKHLFFQIRWSVKMTRKIQPIQAIFKNDRTGLICQDILKYSIEGENKEDDGKSFRLWYLIKWLLKTNQEFANHFKDPSTRTVTTSNKIKYRTPRVEGRIEDLVKLGLVVQIGTARELKGNGTARAFNLHRRDML